MANTCQFTGGSNKSSYVHVYLCIQRSGLQLPPFGHGVESHGFENSEPHPRSSCETPKSGNGPQAILVLFRLLIKTTTVIEAAGPQH